MKVLIGIDNSPYSKNALELVRKLEWPDNTRMLVASSTPILQPVYTEAGFAVNTYDKDTRSEDMKEHEELVSVAEKELKDAGYRTEGHVLQGDPREALIDLAVEEGVDLMVVGSHGRTGLAKVLMGSVASHVVTHAPCSVLVVKRPSRAA